jgi:hypothetical protein
MTDETTVRHYLTDQEQRQALAVLNCRGPLSPDQLRLVLCCLLTGPATSESDEWELLEREQQRLSRETTMTLALIEGLERTGVLPSDLARTLREQEVLP